MPESAHTALLKKVQRSWKRRWANAHRDPPAQLFHYTGAHGLKGILDSNRIWASNALYLNDSSELVYAHEVVTHVVDELAPTYADTVAGQFLTTLADSPLLGRATGSDWVASGFGAHVACFCEQDDLLSQWRGYPGEGGGYTIAFNLSGVAATTRADAGVRLLMLRRVIYDAAKQRKYVRSILEPICQGLTELTDGVDSASDECARVAAEALFECSFCFKHPTFAEEAEWRLIELIFEMSIFGLRLGLGTGKVRVRPTRTGLIPYVELALGSEEASLPISGLTIGPTPHPDLAERAVRILLDSTGYGTVEIKHSGVPLRI